MLVFFRFREDHSPLAAAIYVHSSRQYIMTNDPPAWISEKLKDPVFKAHATLELEKIERIAPR